MIITLLILTIIGYYSYKKYSTSKYVDNVLAIMSSKNNFFPEYYQIMANNSGVIAINNQQRVICVIDNSNIPFYLHRNNIQNAEILTDEETERGKEKLKTLAKYHLYKSTFGETSADLAINLARTLEYKKVKSLQLKISTNDLNKPNIYLLFLKNGNINQKRKIINDIYDWIARIETIKN